MITVKIDKFGKIHENGKYNVILTGSYYWSCIAEAFVYEIKSVEPHINIKKIISKIKL